MGREISYTSPNIHVEDFAHSLKQAQNAAATSLEWAADYMAKAYNKKQRPARPYQVGDQVWLEATNLTTHQPSKKLAPRCYGPFSIEKKVSQSSYRLCLPPTWKIHPVFNESLLTPYIPPHFPNQQPPQPPPPEIVDGSEEYEVKEILDSRFHRKQLQYLVKWRDYPSEENTWEPE